jgi:hypothetical protein
MDVTTFFPAVNTSPIESAKRKVTGCPSAKIQAL